MIAFRHNNQNVSLADGEAWVPADSRESYRDNSTDEMRSLLNQIEAGTPWRKAVAVQHKESYPWLYHIVTSARRDLFFQQHPPRAGARIIDIGSGWGQIALPLAKLSHVTALEPTIDRLSFIRAAARQEHVDRNMCFVRADFLDVQFDTQFDLACCIGVLEWVPKFRDGDPYRVQVDFLKTACRALAPDGRLILGIENRIGLKYILGAVDDHIDAPLVAVYDHELAARKWTAQTGKPLRSFTYTRVELTEMLREAGFEHLEFFAAFPDYKLPEAILPVGESVNQFFCSGGYIEEHNGTNGTKLLIQEELKSHYHSLARLGIAHEFVPSFFVSAQKGSKA